MSRKEWLKIRELRPRFRVYDKALMRVGEPYKVGDRTYIKKLTGQLIRVPNESKIHARG